MSAYDEAREALAAFDKLPGYGIIAKDAEALASALRALLGEIDESYGHVWSDGCSYGAMHGYTDANNPYRREGWRETSVEEEIGRRLTRIGNWPKGF